HPGVVQGDAKPAEDLTDRLARFDLDPNRRRTVDVLAKHGEQVNVYLRHFFFTPGVQSPTRCEAATMGRGNPGEA
ncbi:MAG: hypothetical protein ACE5E5_16585, partial [Phycisphaerae bacterium]